MELISPGYRKIPSAGIASTVDHFKDDLSMRHLCVLAWLAVVSASAFAQPKGELNIASVVGPIYVGNGSTSSGNVTIPTTADAGAVIQLIAEGMDSGGEIVIRPGTYYFQTSATISRSIRVRHEVGAVLHARDNTGAVAFYAFIGADSPCVEGGTFLATEWVNDQSLIFIYDCETPRIKEATFRVDAAGGSGSNPMTMVYMQDCDRATVTDSHMHPAAGVRMIYALDCARPIVTNSYFGPLESEASRNCWRAVDVSGGSAIQFTGNRLADLGTISAQLDACILATEDVGNVDSHGDKWCQNEFYKVASANTMRFLGRKGFVVSGNTFFGGVGIDTHTITAASTAHDATILLDNVNQTLSAGQTPPEFSAHFHISDNYFDGNSVGTSDEIIVKSAGKGEILANHFTHQEGPHTIAVYVLHTQNISIENNYFDGNLFTGQNYPVYFWQPFAEDEEGEEIGSQSKDLWVEAENIRMFGNHADGYRYGLPFNISTYPQGQGQFPIQIGLRGVQWTGYQTWATLITSSTLTFSNASPVGSIADSGSGLGAIAVGDWVQVVGASNNQNNGLFWVATASASAITVSVPSAINNCDPTHNSGNGWNFASEVDTAGVKIYVYPKDRSGVPAQVRSSNVHTQEL